MEAVSADRFSGDVAADATVSSLVKQVIVAEHPHAVIEGGKIIGQISAASVLDVLTGER